MTLLHDQLSAAPTATSVVRERRINQPTQLSSDVIASNFGALRSDAEIVSADVAGLHNGSLLRQLEARTDEAAKRSPFDLLGELSDKGLSWTSIARLVGASVPAIRKWRQAEPVSGDNRRKLARVVALIGVLERDHLIGDAASWLDMPLAESTVTGVDVFAEGYFAELLEFAAAAISGAELLDRVAPDWRPGMDERFEVYRAEDGERAIRFHDEARLE
jgi:hypothetical protein